MSQLTTLQGSHFTFCVFNPNSVTEKSTRSHCFMKEPRKKQKLNVLVF
jgi:hypothetical protein